LLLLATFFYKREKSETKRAPHLKTTGIVEKTIRNTLLKTLPSKSKRGLAQESAKWHEFLENLQRKKQRQNQESFDKRGRLVRETNFNEEGNSSGVGDLRFFDGLVEDEDGEGTEGAERGTGSSSETGPPTRIWNIGSASSSS
jgi:hypothetical protein